MDLQDHPCKELIQASLSLGLTVTRVLDAAKRGEIQLPKEVYQDLRSARVKMLAATNKALAG